MITYDEENRLTAWEKGGDRSEYVYNGLSQRVETREYMGSPGNWSLVATRRYLYAGRLPVAELDGTNALLRTYTRGLDLSTTLSGAGGTGGLLALSGATGPGYYSADANGNITDLTGPTGQALAHYAYSPFGQRLDATGPLADTNPFQWSSQMYEPTAQLVHYLYRSYDSSLGRWVSRDLIGENGGANLYSYVKNNAILYIDYIGLWTVERKGKSFAIAKGNPGETIQELAQMIGLKAEDYQQWLTVPTGQESPTSHTSKIKRPCEYEIPNTMIAYWGGDLGATGQAFVAWGQNKKKYEQQGFKVQSYQFKPNYQLVKENIAPPSSSKPRYQGTWKEIGGGSQSLELQDILTARAKAKQLHGLYFWGHGNDFLISAKDGPRFSPQIIFSNIDLPYGMAVGILNACNSDSGKKALSSNAPGHTWEGACGLLIPLPGGSGLDIQPSD